jgi:hypothetical protein
MRPEIRSPKLRAKIERALRQGGDTHTLDDLLDSVADGMAGWIESESGESVIVAEVSVSPRKRAAHAFVVAGDMHEVLHELQPRLHEFARQNDCTDLTCCGRVGWTQVLPEHGWRVNNVTLSRPVASTEANNE